MNTLKNKKQISGTVLIVTGLTLTASFSIFFIKVIAVLLEALGVYLVIRSRIDSNEKKKLVPPIIAASTVILAFFIYFFWIKN